MAEPSEPLPPIPPERRKNIAALYAKAKQALASGNLDYAIEMLITCCKLDPASVPMRQELRKTEKSKYKDNKKGRPFAFLYTWRSSSKMEVFAKTRKPLKAIEAAEEVLRHNPWHLRSLLVMAQAFKDVGLSDLAVWSLDQARQIQPNDPNVNRTMAKLFEERGQFVQAIKLWKLVAEKLPKDKEAAKKANELAASATIAKGKYDQAITGEAPTPSMTPGGSSPQMPALDGQPTPTYADQRIAKDATAFIERIKQTPDNANAYIGLAQYYRRNERESDARDTLKQGLAAIPNNFELSMELADLNIDESRRNLAMCEEKLKANPKDAEAAATRTKLQKEVNSRELEYYRQRSDRNPADAAARYEMAVRLYKTGQYDAAIQELQKVRTDPKHKVRVLIYLGFCFKARNNWRLAQRNFEDARTSLTQAEESFKKEIMFQLATGYAENGEVPKAVELGCELANLDYGYKNIGGLIEQWQAKLASR